jgi:SAM-dependent methyltransferase
MAIFTFKAPNGKRYTVSGSEGATQEEALDYLIANWDTLQDFPVTSDAEKEKVAEQPVETSIAQEQPVVQETEQPVAEQPESESGDFSRGFQTAYKQLPQLGYGLEAGALAAGESILGEGGKLTELKKEAVSKYEQAGKELETISKPTDSPTYSFEKAMEGDYGSLVDTLQYGLGYGAAQLSQGGIASLGGKLVGKAVARATAENIAEKMVVEEAAKLSAQTGAEALTQEQLKAAATQSVANKMGDVGSKIAIGSQAFGMEAGEIGGELAKQSVDENRTLTNEEVVKGLGSAIAATALEYGADRFTLGALMGRGSLSDVGQYTTGVKGKLARGAALGASAGGVEFGTEFFQSGIEQYGQGKDILSNESLREDIDSAILGSIGGGAAGVAGGMLSSAKQKPDTVNPEGTPIAESMLQGGLPTSEPTQPQTESPVTDTLRAYTDIFKDENLNPTPPTQTVDTTAPIVDNETIAKDVINSNTLDDALQTFNNTVEANTYGHEVNMEYANKIADRFTGKKEIEIQDKDYQDSVQLENQLSTVRDELAYKKFQTAFEESNQQASKEEFDALVEQEIQDKNQQLKSVLDQQLTQKAQRFEASVPSTNTVIENEQWARTRNNRNAVIQMVFDRNLPAENIFPAIKAELKRQGFNDTQLSQDDIEAYTFLKEYPQANVQPSPQVIPTSVNEMDVESLIKEKPQAIQTEQLSPALSKVNEWVNNGATYKNGMLFDSKGKKFVLNKAQRKYYFMSRSSPLMQTPVAMGEGTVETRQGQDQISGVEEPNTPTAEMPTAEMPTAEMPTAGTPVTTYYNEPNGKYYGDVKEVTKIMPQELKPLNQTEINWAISSQKASGKSEEEWAKSVDLSEPIKATIYSDGEIKIQDGHHRYLAGKILNEPLNVELKSINAKNQILNDAINRINKDVSQATVTETPTAEIPVAETPIETKGTINNPILRKNGKAFTSQQGAQTHIRTNPELSKDTHTWVKLGEEKYGIVTEDQVVRKPTKPATNNLRALTGLEPIETAIGKLGGINREMANRAGFSDFKGWYFTKTSSEGFDGMALLLADKGYDVDGENDLIAKLRQSLAGKKVYTFQGLDNDIAKMLADREDDLEQQQQDELLNTYTNEEVNAILDAKTQAEKDKIIADIKAEKKRKADLEVDTVADEMLGKGMATSGDLFAPERKGKATVGREVTIEGEQLANSPLELKKLYPNHWFYGDKGAQSKFDETEIDYETQYPNLESVSLINTDSNIGGFYDQVEQAIYQTSQSDRTTLHELGHAIHHQLLNYRKLTEDERATLKELLLGDAEANHPYLASDKELVAEFNLYAHVFPVKAKAYAPELYKELVEGRKDVSIKLGSQDNKALTAALKQANVTIEKGYGDETYNLKDQNRKTSDYVKEIFEYSKEKYVKQKLASNPNGDIEKITAQAEREHRAAIELAITEGQYVSSQIKKDYPAIWEKRDVLRKKYEYNKFLLGESYQGDTLENRRNAILEEINSDSDTYTDKYLEISKKVANYLGFKKFKNTGVFTIFKNSNDEYLVFNNPKNFLDYPSMVAFDKKGNVLVETELDKVSRVMSIDNSLSNFSENDIKQIANKIKEVYGDLSKTSKIARWYRDDAPKNINEFAFTHPTFGYSRTDIFKYEMSKAIPNLIKPSSLKFSKAKSQQRLAPNGKPSNLNEVQYEQVRTPEFKEWFGDWENDPENASKVVDENGEPMVVYHGTSEKFWEFNEYKGNFFTQDPNYAKVYSSGKKPMALFLNIRNPFDSQNKKDNNFYNTKFIPYFSNKYPRLSEGLSNLRDSEPLSFIWADKLFSALRHFERTEKTKYDGMIVDEGDTPKIAKSNAFFAFVPLHNNQIKSATDNIGAFSKESNDIRFSKTAKKVLDENPLAIIHNLSLSNLTHADKMGGIAVPSVAIVNQKYPLSGFGEITLIGNTSQFAPEVNAKNKYFNADVYSPRYPQVTYVVDSKTLNSANESLSDDTKELAKAIGNRGLINASSIEDRGVLKGLQDSVTLKYEFLKSIGKAPKMQYRPNKTPPASMKKFVSSKIDVMELKNDVTFVQAVVDIFNESIKKRNETLGTSKPYIEIDSQQASNLAFDYQYAIKEFRDQKGAQKSIDDYATSKLIREKTNQAQYEKWLVENYSNLVSDERIFNGYTSSGKRVYLPHNLDTVVKLMTKTIKGGENVSYGIGTIRAYTAKQFKTVKQIQDARGDIVSDEKLAQLKEELESEFNSISDELRPYSDYSDPSATDALSDLVSKGLRAFKESYQDVPQETMSKVYSFLDKLKNMPAHYFEGKIGRAVDIGEFSGALVPKGKEYDEAVKILNANGITKIKRYTEGDAQSRSDALLNFSDLLFGKNRQPATNTHTEQSLKEGLTKAGDDAYGKGWTDKLLGTGMFEIISDEQAQAIIEESTGTKFALVGDRSAANTQIDTTMGAYAAVARNLFAKIPNLKNILDYGAGKGRGTASVFRALTNKGMDVNVKSYEPFPENWAKSLTDEPDFTNADNIKDGSQDAVVNLNVLNVVPRAIRDDIVKNIGRILKDGGVGVISSRRWKGDVDTIKPANSKAGEEPNSFYVTRKLKGVEQTNYQKGIEPDELVAYVQELLPDFDVRKINGYGASAVIIQKSGGTPILDSILKPVKKEKVEIGSAETEALRKEAKELGAGERYSEFGVGKKMGDEVYLHRDYEGVLPQGDLADAKERIDDFEYNLIRYNTKTGAIGFFNSPDFDTSPEPINGNLIVVEPDGTIRTVDLNKNPDKQAIYHHKWEWVKDDYKGFDVKQSIERSIAWQKVVNREGIDRKRIGFQGVWQNEVLKPFDIKYSKNGDIEAFYNPADGKTYFVAENIDKEKDLHYLMMHEVSVHALNMGGNKDEFEAILKQVDNLVKVKNPAAVKGRQDALDADTPQEDLREETLAYLIKYAPKLKIVQRFKAWLKNALRNMSKLFPASQKLGFIQWANNLSDQDLLYIAEATLRKAPEMLVAQRQDTGNVKFSLAQNEENLFNLPAETKFQFMRKWIQDDLLRIRIVMDKIREQGGKVDESNDVVLAMEAAGNIAANQLESLKERFIQPLIDRMAKMNVNKDEIGLLLYAKHAPERNAYIQSINPTFRKLGEGGSGMTDKESAAIIERYKETMGDKYPEFEKLVDDWQNIQNIVKRILVQSGDISPEQAQAWDDGFDYHVPLKGFEEVDEITGKATKKSSNGNIGQGFSISGKFDRRALGRQSRANQIVENIVMNLERAVIRSSKMYVQSVLYKLIEDNPDANLWETEVTPMKPIMGKAKAQYVMYFHGSEIGQRDTLRDARRYVEAETERTGQSKREYEIIKVGGEPQVTLMKKPYDQNEEISYWRNGKQVRITVNDPEFVQAFNRLGDENIYSMFKVMSAFNRFLRHAYTILNPVFIIANGVMVDPAVALYTNTARKGFKYASTVLANTPMASLQLAKYMAKGTSGNAQWDNTIKSYLDNGGKSGTAFISSIEQKADELNLAVLKSKMMDTKFYEYPLDKLKLMVVDNKLANLMKYLGEVGETATRLSTFKVAVDKGMSPQEAAKVARNVTINFNRRGIAGRELGAMYLFLNASIQGTENLIDATIRGEHKAQATAILSTYVALGYLIALLGGDDGDDDLIPEEEKNRYVSIVLDKETGLRVNWKLAYGLSFFKDVGTAIHRIQAGGDVEKITNKLMSSFFGNFAYVNPMVSGEWDSKDLIAGMIPTFGRIPYSVINNRNQWGKPIYPEDVYNTTVPDSEKEWSTTRGTMYSDFAKWMNKVTGGTKVESGLVDISPEAMKYLTNALTGSAGTQVYKFVNSIYTSSMNAEEMGLHNLPVVSGFVKENTIDSYRNVYNSQRKEAKDIYDKFKKYEKLGDDEATDKFTSKHQPTLDFYDETKSIIKEVKDLRDKQDEARVEGDKALVKELEAEEKQLLIEYSYQYNQRQ